MPDKEPEVFSNPLPPPSQEEIIEEDDSRLPLTNEDFRKLMMTPRVPGGSASVAPMAPPMMSQQSKPASEEDDAAEKRKKKKSYYAKLKKMEEERQKELAQKYRDRARERRDGVNTDYEQTEVVSTTADYRAVAPDAQAGESYAERRQQIIQESKYLGGDMEHTHLVKGLDYALLEKVRAEITSKEIEDEEVMENIVQKQEKKEDEEEVQMFFRTKMGRNIFRTLFKQRHTERNELFLPGRMAYVVDLDEDAVEAEIPTTLIRSKADCPTLESTTTLSTNDIVIHKLTQILSYLRQGRRDKKMKRKDKGKLKDEDRPKLPDDAIYGELGDYNPLAAKPKDREREKKERQRERDRDRDKERDRDRRDRDHHDRGRTDRDRDRHERDKRERDRGDRGREKGADKEKEKEKKSYFEKPAEEDDVKEDRGPSTAKELVRSINDRFAKGWSAADIEREKTLHGEEDDAEAEKKASKEAERIKKKKTKIEIDSYAECYPGMMESADAIDDSDDEVDYTKMDQGNKKGPIGRWDFETQEEYSDYMASKEALPKAAFQYGVKMADGRKTRRTGPKDEKKELDREWQKIQNIIAKRKQMASDGEPYSKAAKY